MGEASGTSNVDVPRTVFQIFGELLSVTSDLKGEWSNATTLLFFYCLVIMKNFGPVSRNFESMQFMDARILKVLTRLLTLIVKHIEKDSVTSPLESPHSASPSPASSSAPPLSGSPVNLFSLSNGDGLFSWREYSLFILIQQAFAVALTKRAEIRSQLRDLKVLEELHLKFLGRPPGVLPQRWATYLTSDSPETPQSAIAATGTVLSSSASSESSFSTLASVPSMTPISRLQLDPFTPMCAQIAIIEMLATAFLDTPSIRRWSAVGGFKLLINVTLWVAQWMPDPTSKAAWESIMGSRKAAKAKKSKKLSSPNVSSPNGSSPGTAKKNKSPTGSDTDIKAKLPSLPLLSPNDAPQPAIAPLPAVSENSGVKAGGIVTRTMSSVTTSKAGPGTLFSASWDIFNPRLVRIFEAFFHMVMCSGESETFNHRIMAAVCGIFDKSVLATPENEAAREHLHSFPEAQLSFLCLLNSLFSRNSRSAEELFGTGVWDTLLNSGYFLRPRDPLSGLRESSTPTSAPKVAPSPRSDTVAASILSSPITSDEPSLNASVDALSPQSNKTSGNLADSALDLSLSGFSDSDFANDTPALTQLPTVEDKDSTSSNVDAIQHPAETISPRPSNSGPPPKTRRPKKMHPQLAAISDQLISDMSASFFKFIEHLGCSPGRNNETEIMVLSSILTSPYAATCDKERAAQTMSLMFALNPVSSANAIVHFHKHAHVLANSTSPPASPAVAPSLSKHRSSASTNTSSSSLPFLLGSGSGSSANITSNIPGGASPQASPRATPTPSKPFLLIARPTIDEKRKNGLNATVSGFGCFMHQVLDLIDLTVSKRGQFTAAEIAQLQSASTSLVIAINKLLSSESVKHRLQTDPGLLNDIILLLEDTNPHIFRFGLHTVAELLRGGTSAERASNPTFYQLVSNRVLDYLTKRQPTATLTFEIALLDTLATICTPLVASQAPPIDLQELVFQGHLKIFALLDRIVNDQERWQRQMVIEALVSATRVFNAMMQDNDPHQQTFASNGDYDSLYHIFSTVARVQSLSKSLLIELVRIMMNGRDEILHICMKLDVLPNRPKPANPFIVTTTLPPKRLHSSRSALVAPSSPSSSGNSTSGSPRSVNPNQSLPPLPANIEHGEVPGSFIAPNLLPSMASASYENDEVLSPEAFEPPRPRAAALLFSMLTMFAPAQQVLLLDMFNFLVTQAQSTNVTLSYFSAEGMLSKALSLIRSTADEEIASRLFQFIGALGRHTISVRDIGHIFSLFKALPGDFRPPWTIPLLEALDSMIETSDTPPYYFHFDGVDAALIIPPLSRFPLGRGFTFSAWIQFEDFQDPIGRPNYQPRIISFLDNSGRGFELVVIRKSFCILVHRENNRTETVTLGAAKDVQLQAQTWYFVTLTYSVSTSLLSKQGTFKLYFGDRFIDKGTCKLMQFNDLAHCYIGSCYIHNNHTGAPESPSSAGNSSSATDPRKGGKKEAESEADSNFHRSTNRSFYGYMSEIAFFDEEISHQHVLAMRNGASKEAFLRSNEWNAVFDPMAQTSAISLTMSYSPRNTTATVTRDQKTFYLDPYRSEVSQRFKHSDHATSALTSIQQATGHITTGSTPSNGSTDSSAVASETSSVVHICYDSSSYTRDAVMHKGLHVVHRTTIRSLISCISGGANVLIPLIQLIEKSSELTSAQIQAKRAQRPAGHSRASNLTLGGTGLSSSSSELKTPSDSIVAASSGEESTGRWSMAKVPRLRPGATINLTTMRLNVNSDYNSRSASTISPALLKTIMAVTLNMLHASTELQLQIHLTRGFELISFLLVRSNPGHMSEELLDLLKANMEPKRFPRVIQDGILEHLLLEAHLWIYTPYGIQQKLWADCLQSVFIRTGTNGKFRSRVGAVSRLLEIIRIYYWETGSPANVMASEPVVSAQTGDVLAQRPVVPQLRVLRKLIYSLISALILKETCEDDTLRREFVTIMTFLRECSDAILVSELLEYLEELYRKIPYYFERFLEWIHATGSTALLQLLDNRPLEVRVRVIALINALIQSKFIQQLSSSPPSSNTLAVVVAPDKVPVLFSNLVPLPSPLIDFPVVAIFDHLASQSIDQALYDAIIALVLLLPPYYRGKYLLNPDTGEASIIRLWPALSGLARLLSGRHVALQTLFVDDFSYLITGNDVNLENMLTGAPTWPHWFLSACMKPEKPPAVVLQPSSPKDTAQVLVPKESSSGSTSNISSSFSSALNGSSSPSTSASPTPSSPPTPKTQLAMIINTPPKPSSGPAASSSSIQVDPLDRLTVKSIDTLKNIAARILTHKTGSQLIVDWFCWFRAFMKDETRSIGQVDVDHFESLFAVVCKEIVLLVQREIDTAFADESFQNFLTKSSVPVPPPQGGPIIPASKSFMLSLSNSVVALMSIAEYALQMWTVGSTAPAHLSVYALPNVASSSDSFGKDSSFSSLSYVPGSSDLATTSSPNISAPSTPSPSSVGAQAMGMALANSTADYRPGSLASMTYDEADNTLGISPTPFNAELILALLRVLEKLETELDRFANLSLSTPTEMVTYRVKWGFRTSGSCSLILRLTCALFGTNVKAASLRPFAGNITRAMSAGSRKVTTNEAHLAFYVALMNIWIRFKDGDSPQDSAWSDMITAFFIAPLASSNEIISMLSSSKTYDHGYTDFLRKFVASANLGELVHLPAMEPLVLRLKRKLQDVVKEDLSGRKSAKNTMNKTFTSIKATVSDELMKVRTASKQANETGSKAWEKLSALPRVMDPKVIRENYARTAYRWRDTLRVLKGETGPWGNTKPTTHWKVSRVEAANRSRPFYKRNYHFNDHRDAAYSVKIAKHGGGASAAAIAAAKAIADAKANDTHDIAPQSVKRLSSYNLGGFLKSSEKVQGEEIDIDIASGDASGGASANSSAPTSSRGSTDEEDINLVRLDSRMGLPTAEGVATPVLANSGTSNTRIASRISMMVGGGIPAQLTGASSNALSGLPSSSQALPSMNMQQKQAPTIVSTCLWIRPMQITRGTLEVTPTLLRFKPIEIVSTRASHDSDDSSTSSTSTPNASNSDDPKKGLPRERTWAIDSILEIRLRRYLLQHTALEMFFADRTNHFFAFPNKDRKDVFSTLVKYVPPSSLAESRTPEQVWRSSDMTKRWQMRQISNFEYLMYMNTLGGRSFNDISQYPVFPWIVTDMTSPTLDLNDPSIYRDLSKPVGALNPNRLESFLARYESLEEEDKKFLYGSHYSSAANVLFFLIRMEPFTTLAIELQDGSFDISDRMFNSVPTCWANCQTASTDVKELIPEFYYNPDFLVNFNKFPLGTLHTGEQADNVTLPPWAKTPDEFVATLRRALESDYVSENLHNWIDLIFGYKQRGQEALNANNLFHFLSYEGMVNWDELTKPHERHATETSVREFGQTPQQVLRKPHPPRGAISIPDCLLPDFMCRKDESFAMGKGRVGWIGFTARKGEILTIDSNGKVRAGATNLTTAAAEGGRLPNDTPFAYRIFNSHESAVRISAPHLPQNVRTCAISRDSGILFSCLHDDNSIRCLSLESYRNVASLNSHKDLVTCLALSEDGALLVSGSKDTTVRVWAAIPGRSGYGPPFMSLNDHDDEVVCVAVNSALGVVASSSKDSTIILHYLNSSEYITSIRHPLGENHIYDLIALSQLGYVVAYSHSCSTLYVYTMNGRCVFQEEAHELPRALLLTKDGEFIITGGRRGTTGAIVIRRILPPSYDNAPKILITTSAPIWSLCYTPDENYLLAGLETGHILIKDLPSKRLYIR